MPPRRADIHRRGCAWQGNLDHLHREHVSPEMLLAWKPEAAKQAGGLAMEQHGMSDDKGCGTTKVAQPVDRNGEVVQSTSGHLARLIDDGEVLSYLIQEPSCG